MKKITKQNTFKNDATQKLLGYDYQKLIALEFCLKAKKNTHVWIECKGDVADENTTTEIKHHSEKNNITSNSVDVWKTLKNYVSEFEKVKLFNNLVLHTTSIIQDDSIFYNWNNLDTHTKKNKLLSHSPTTTIKNYYDEIKKISQEDLEKILSKFTILEGQINIQQKWEDLKTHPTFTIISDDFRDAALEHLYGYITKKAIENFNEWQININDFQKDIQNSLSKFTKGNTPFPTINKTDPALQLERRDFIFIKKMETIQLKVKEQANAVSDYLCANMAQSELLSMTPTLLDNLCIYDENVKRVLEDNKSKFANNIQEIETSNKISIDLYFNSIGKSHDSIIGVDNTQKYYRDGRIHHTLEGTAFEWKFSEDDL